jgi:hypothetical protein
MAMRKQWLCRRLTNVVVADDFNRDLILAQTKGSPVVAMLVVDNDNETVLDLLGWPMLELDQLLRLTFETAYWRSST